MNLFARAASILVLLGFVAASSEASARADLDDLEALVEGNAISVAVTLTGVFDQEETIERLQSGLPLVILYEFDLIRKRENWFDSILTSSEIELVATYNSLTREYLLNDRRDRKLVSSESIRTIDELRKRMTLIRIEALFPLDGLRPGELRLRARAVFGRRYLMHVIPRLVATEWDVVRVETRDR